MSQNYTLKFEDLPSEFVEQTLTNFQKQSLIIKYIIREEIGKSENKTEAIDKLSQSLVSGVKLSPYTIRNLYYESTSTEEI
jgi:hypothetical protein